MNQNTTIYLHTGSNIGNRIANLQIANAYLKQHIGTIKKASQYYHTAAWGVTDQPSFINQALELSTNLSPFEILENIQQIEASMGRIRHEKWGERLIDIDLLFYEKVIIQEENLQVPHPFLQERKFVLVPLQEIAADWIHPIFNRSIQDLFEKTTDDLSVVPFASIFN